MVIYEVNLNVQKTIFHSFKQWLTSHINEMLSLQGFIRATLLQEVEDNVEDGAPDEFVKLTVQYQVSEMADLDHYIKNHADRMQRKGLNRFPNQFKASRRLFDVKVVFEGNNQ